MSAALFLLPRCLLLGVLFAPNGLGPLIQDIGYTYDTVANVTLIGDDINLGSACDSLENITYDALHRLKSYARDGQTTLFNYDEIGNITLNQEMGSAEYVYFGNTRPHAVWGANRVYAYDEAGNMTLRNGQTLVYDEQNRLRQVDNVYYFYNDDGERVRKTHFGAETVWIDDLYEREPGRPLCHVQAGGKRIVTFSADGVEVYYYHSDHLGSSSLMTDQDGSLVRQQYSYRCFGSERFSLSFWPSFTSRFTGQPYDAETGLYCYQSRYYDPELGRFIQPDSIVPTPNSSQSLNRYSYVLNNPLKYIDPTGHAEQQTSFFGGSGSLGFGSGHNWLGLGWGAGSLGFGAGRDWLGLGWQAGGYGTMGLSSIADPYTMWDALSDSPSGISGYDRASFLDKWKAQPARAFEDTLKTAASISTLALPFGAPARGAPVVGFFAPGTRLTQVAAKAPADKSWKALIEGAAQKTGTPGHQFRVYREAIKMAKSGEYSRIRLNKAYSTTAEVQSLSRRRPDILAIRRDGRVDALEVPSLSDKESLLLERHWKVFENLSDFRRGEVIIAPIR